MKFGVCGRKFPDAATLGPERILDRVHALGFDGVFFRSILDLDPNLDADHLRRLRRRADDYGLYLEVGLGKVNPFNTPETPAKRAPRWRASDPDLSEDEVTTLLRHADETDARVRRGEILDPDSYYPAAGLSSDEQVEFIRRCHAHLRLALAARG